MKRLIFSLVGLLLCSGAVYAQELQFSKEQIDSILTEAEKTYQAPKIQGLAITGIVEELAAEFCRRGWIDPFSRFSEEDLDEAGLGAGKRYVNGILLEGIFLGNRSNLVLYPISQTDRRVAYAAITFNVDENSLRRFIEKDVMSLVHRYETKYGTFEIIDVDPLYQHAKRNTTREQYGPSQHIISFSFEDDPSVMLRAQTDADGEFSVVIHYVNTLNLVVQLLLNPDPYEEI